jgi:CBS domain-containing protein
MTEKRIRPIPVVVKGALAGIVSIGDAVKNRIDEIEDDAKSMRAFITGT